jgi:hypothetical protein
VLGGAQEVASAAPWSAPARVEACPALDGAQVLFPSDKPEQPTGPGALAWQASAACAGGEGPRISRIGANDVPGTPTAPVAAPGRTSAPAGALLASTAPHGQILLAGAAGGTPIQGLAGSPFSGLGSLTGRPVLAIANAYLDDVALATAPPTGGVELDVERWYGHGVDRSATISKSSPKDVRGLTLAMDFRSDALAVWTQSGSILAHDMPASGSTQQIQHLGAAASHLQIAALLSDDNRGIAAWSEESGGVVSVYLDRSAPGVRFHTPSLLERFPQPDGLAPPPASPRLIRLSSESVMVAWAGASEGHWVVRTAAIDLLGVGAPNTIAAPATDALLADLVPGPDDDALVLWTQPQPLPTGPGPTEQSIFAARGFDAYPRRTEFGTPEQVAPTGPDRDTTVAFDPHGDGAIALWRGANDALEYAIRSPADGS